MGRVACGVANRPQDRAGWALEGNLHRLEAGSRRPESEAWTSGPLPRRPRRWTSGLEAAPLATPLPPPLPQSRSAVGHRRILARGRSGHPDDNPSAGCARARVRACRKLAYRMKLGLPSISHNRCRSLHSPSRFHGIVSHRPNGAPAREHGGIQATTGYPVRIRALFAETSNRGRPPIGNSQAGELRQPSFCAETCFAFAVVAAFVLSKPRTSADLAVQRPSVRRPRDCVTSCRIGRRPAEH